MMGGQPVHEWDGKFEMIDPRLIINDRRYQRDEKDAHVTNIRANFDWREFGVIVCAKRPNGLFYAIDGQQRLAAVMMLDPRPKTVPVVWFEFAQVEEESAKFTGMNERRKALHPLEMFKARLTAKDPAALAIERAIETAGFSLGYNDESARTIGCVGVITKIYNDLGEDGLVRLLVISRDAWGDDKKAVSSQILSGLCDIACEANGTFDRQKITSSLKKTTPALILRKAEELHFDMGGTKRVNVRRAYKKLAKV